MAPKLLTDKNYIPTNLDQETFIYLGWDLREYYVVSAESEQECDNTEDSNYFESMPLWYKDCGFNSVIPNLWETEYEDKYRKNKLTATE